MTHKFAYTAQDMRQLRDTLGISMQEARHLLIQQELLQTVANANSVDELKPVLQLLISHTQFAHSTVRKYPKHD